MNRLPFGVSLISVGLFVTVLIDGHFTGNPGPIHGIVTGNAFWGGVIFLVGGCYHVQASILEGTPTHRAPFYALSWIPGPLIVADHFLRNPVFLSHTIVAGVLVSWASASVILFVVSGLTHVTPWGDPS